MDRGQTHLGRWSVEGFLTDIIESIPLVPEKVKNSNFSILIEPESPFIQNGLQWTSEFTSDRKSHMLISMYDLYSAILEILFVCLFCSDFPYRATSSSELFITLPGMGEEGGVGKEMRETSCARSLMSYSQNEVDHYCSRHIVPFPQPVAYRLVINGQWLYHVPATA